MKKLSLPVQILIALVLGVIVGLMLRGNPDIAVNYIKPFGTLFLNLIKLIIVPLVFSSLITGVGNLNDVKQLGRLGGKTLAFYLITTAFAVSLGLIMANVFNVGGGYVLPTEELVVEVKEAPSVVETLLGIIPANPLKAIVEGNMLQIIAFAIILGSGILVLGEKGKILFQVFDSLAETMYVITGAIMRLAPIGVFALIVPVIAEHGAGILQSLLRLIIIAYVASFIHAGVIYSASVQFLGGMSPIKFFKGISPASILAFTTSSSSGTLPVTMKCCEDNLGVSKPVASFVLPLGATINMDGTAIYQGVSALFIAQVFGIDLSIGQQLGIVLTATLASIGTAGVPGAGMIMLTLVLQSTGLPLEGIALIAGVDRILDMIRTSVNVTGDAACAVVVAKSEGELSEVN
ncbi:dicarboxylate/amino acid:cation symporter [Microaceticoccus formicicus]|uniref:dicarboxylate/amino acid:cation symporter n=1 Tax=Microaceticoccus formicicus TaxID=3118105 RepID=UPI003CD00793|nr:dicarboxylate/amino acid:cation symporter [Peptoniphilaceae bacterium AMB_02]